MNDESILRPNSQRKCPSSKEKEDHQENRREEENKRRRSIKIRTAQIKTAGRTAQLTAAVLKEGRAIRAERRRVILPRRLRVFPLVIVQNSLFRFVHTHVWRGHSCPRMCKP